MLDRIRQATAGYPRQFWLLFWGKLISAAGGSMIWPFLTIYMRQQLDIPLTTVTLLFTLNSAAGLMTTFVAGPAVDRFGRKGAMFLSLAARCRIAQIVDPLYTVVVKLDKTYLER